MNSQFAEGEFADTTECFGFMNLSIFRFGLVHVKLFFINWNNEIKTEAYLKVLITNKMASFYNTGEWQPREIIDRKTKKRSF